MLEDYQITQLLTTLIVGVTVVFLAYSPLPRAIGQALAQRLMHGKTPAPGSAAADQRLEDVIEDNSMLRRQLEEMQERMEFAERMLAQARDRGQLGAAGGGG